MVEFPAVETERKGFDSVSRRRLLGTDSDSVTSEGVNLLTKMSSPFQEVWRTSPGGSSETSSSLYESLIYLVLVIIWLYTTVATVLTPRT